MEHPWDQGYPRDVPPDFEEMRKREDRKERIKPYWDSLVNDKEPKVNKDCLLRLMHDLKEEGNALFKQGHFDIAWMHYRNAIFVVRILENRFYHVVEKEFTSSLFSNRAFCCLKKSMFKEAAQDCDSAIAVYPKNIKAYYRQAQAYKQLKNYAEAYKSAIKGQNMQESSALKELIDELEPYLKPGGVTEASLKAAQTLTSGNTKTVDNDWLAGTNIKVTEKHLESKTKMPKKSKKKNKGSNSAKNTVIEESQPDTESDDSSTSLGPEDDTEFANMISGVRNSPTKMGNLLNGQSHLVGLNINPPPPDEEAPWSFPHDSDNDEDVAFNAANSMGLDSFSPAEFRTSDNVESEATSVTMSNTSSGRSSRASQSPTKSATLTSRSSSASASPAPAPPPPQITFPLQDDFDFRLVCRHCFVKVGDGVKGFRYDTSAHPCVRDVLIVRKRNVQGMNWVKVRLRPDVKGHYGGYKVCTQFSQGKSCKVSEEKCTFPHTQPELALWSMDRDGLFSIVNFISLCKQYKLYDSAAISTQKTKQQYIPGLNYAGNKGKKQTQQQSTLEMGSGGDYDPHMSQGSPARVARDQAPQSAQPTMSQSAYNQSQYGHNTGFFNRPPPAIERQTGFPSSRYQNQNQSQHHAGMFSHPPPSFDPMRATGQYRREEPDLLQEPEIYKTDDQVDMLENPLIDTHDAITACQHCFKPSKYPGIYEYLNITHKCEETMLAMRARDGSSPWVRVRERKNHRTFPGNYILCNSIHFGNPEHCKYGEEMCSFAHSQVEKKMWTAEKDGKFNITEYLIQIRRYTTEKGYTLREVLKKHGGYFDFICRSCIYGQPPQISHISSDRTICNGTPAHNWKDFRIMAHIGGQSGVCVINPRGFSHKTAFFKICQWLQFCRKMVNANCKFAHSLIERDVWMVERDTDIKRDEIVNQSKQLLGLAGAAGPAQTANTLPALPATDTRQQLQPTIQGVETMTPRSADSCIPEVVEVCETCWKRGQKTYQQPGKDRCQKSHANWSCNIVYLLKPSLKELRPLPKNIPKGLNFLVCKYIREGKKCGYTGTGPCQYAHSREELEAWTYMCKNNMKTAAGLSEVSKAAQKLKAESAKPKISGQAVVSATPVGVPTRLVMPMASVHTYYCHYCGVSCNSQKQWDEHCASEKHNFNVNSDKEHQWNYRQPPWTSGRYYELCDRHVKGQTCQYSNVPDMYNLCRFAHSSDELDEWKERYEWRQMKRDMARQARLFSYMDSLLEKYESSREPVKVICEELDDVVVRTQGDLNLYKEEKDATHVWTFTITSMKCLERVALLYNRDRLHFCLVNGMEKACQIAQSDVFQHDIGHQGQPVYRVQVRFTGGMFGSFQQWVLFDFGTEPVMCRKINVEIGNQSLHDRVRNLREQLRFDRWTSQNREIVQHELLEEGEVTMLAKYKEPTSSENVITSATVSTELNQYNYKPKMHKLLDLEEITRHQIIASFNLCVSIECVGAIEESVFVYAQAGELFARVPLKESLTEDTDAGRLILSSVRKVLLAPQTDSNKVVYEAVIVREDNFNYDGRGREFIYLCLSADCVQQLKLKPGVSIDVEIQFQMDRLFFCRMHHAIDSLLSIGIVFPDVPKINPLRNEKHNLKVSSSVLNPDQMAAVRHIVAERTGYTPPFVLYGPFGTGKTETIAQATMVLLKETKDTRVLICAQSNSAADLYILKHFDSYLKKSGKTSLLCRVYHKERRAFTVANEVKKYCLISQQDDRFRMPSREDMEKCRVVIVTVTTSLALTNLNLHGLFSHIFIDEAAQTLEAESLMPLSLATDKTCIVLAGDHHQISPKVYSAEAMKQLFHQSLLERLYNYYDSHSSLINIESPLNILLSVNYRTKMEILRFISAVSYGGPDVLKSEANIRSVLSITPLVFHAVQGREVQDDNNVSYYNQSEVQEIVERVDDLYEKWPLEWGPPSAKDIGVVTPYYDQVLLIRKALRKRNVALKEVTIERVQGVQGKEFRAMFISTVRTRHLMDAPHVQTGGLTGCDGEFGDFGFLSDSKLLNTALTRTQSVVVVVGDPVALCAIGECSKLWQTYLKHCQNMRSLFPQNHTFDSIRQQVQNLLNSPARERQLQMANDRQSGQRHVSNEPESPTPGMPEQLPYAPYNASVDTAMRMPVGNMPINNMPINSMPVNDMADIGNPVPDLSNLHVSPAVIGSPISRPALPNVSLAPPTNGVMMRSPLAPLNPMRFGMMRPIGMAPLNTMLMNKMESYYEVGDEYRISPDEVLSQLKVQETSTNVMLAPGKVGVKEENGFAVLYNKAEQSVEGMDIYPAYTQQQLISLLVNPKRYLRCSLYIEDEKWYAVTAEEAIKIEIPSRFYCGQANNKDEVVLELHTDRSRMYGKVVGVLKRYMDLSARYIVCRKGSNSGVMVPLDEGLSPMFNVITQAHLPQNMEGNVSVYRFTKTKQIRLSYMAKVSAAEVDTKLFAVRFLKYDSRMELPLCVVVGVMPAEPSVAYSTKLLDLEYQVMRSYKTSVSDEVGQRYPANFSLYQDMLTEKHVDLRDRWCFTIDSLGGSDTSRAYSIDQASEDSYQVGVHISDVATYIQKDSNVDLEARTRGTTMCPIQQAPVHMLPDRLATQLCSLKTTEDRLALSVLMVVKSTGELTQVHVQKSLINCKRSFSLKDVEEVLYDPCAHEDYMKSCLLVLSQISAVWRRERLGNAALYQEKSSASLTPFSHQLVEEMGIMTEHHIAKIVSTSFPDVTPFWVQDMPTNEVLDVWKKNHAADAINSIALTKPFLNQATQETCKCGLACTHTVSYVRQHNITKREHIDVISILWDNLNEAVAIGDYSSMQNIIVAAENHPQIAVALSKLRAIEPHSTLVCSSDVVANDAYHYTINTKPTTLFTDALSSYMDIVVQRLLLACLDNQPSPYSVPEMQAICAEGTISQVKKSSYERQNFVVQLSAALLSHPLILQPVVANIHHQLVEICFPTVQSLTMQLINYKLLGVSQQPECVDSQVLLQWKERIYDCTVLQQQQPLGSNSGELNPNRFVYKIPAFQWQRLLIAIREQDEEHRKQKLNTAVDIVGKQVSNPSLDESFIEDVTSEVQKMGNINHYAEFSLRLHASQVLLVQLSARLDKGMLVPYVQLLSLTNSLDVCLQHREHPIESFIRAPSQINTAEVLCSDVQAYENMWRNITEVEAVTQAMANDDRLIVNNVILAWQPGPNNCYTAEMTLPVSFLMQRRIKLTSKFQQSLLFNPANAVFCNAFFSDYMCVRYSNITLPSKTGLCDAISHIVNNRSAVTWVGHCTVTDVVYANENLTFKLELVNSDVPLPLPLVHRQPCSVEIIMRTESDRMILYALKNLESSSQLTRDIILRQLPANPFMYQDTENLLLTYRQILQASNQQQEEALKLALNQPLTVIQGCAGSGKSMLASILALMYTQRNAMQHASNGKHQVLVCAPTEAAVDVINDYFLSLQCKCRVVRTYSNDVENGLRNMPFNVTPDVNLPSEDFKPSQLSLHNIVRTANSPSSKYLEEFESLFSLYKDDVAEDQYEEYLQLLAAAESTVLKDADIILCTCVNSGQLRLSSVLNIQQIIIDDVNSGSEPEVLVPLSVYTHAKHVALLGDVKQLGPDLMSDVAKSLGLGRSIMSSYLTTAVYLNDHFRVHGGIMDFTSRLCYDGRLVCGTMSQRQPSILNWPAGRNHPAAFCKLDGEENKLLYDVNSDAAVCNLQQADFAIKVAVGLVSNYKVSGSNIVIVCATSRQCVNIREQLDQFGQNITVSTMAQVQGLEYDYVIFSTVHSIDPVHIERYIDDQWLHGKLGALSDHGLVVGALTRARKGLIIVGNEALLRCDDLWSKLLNEYAQSNRLVTADHFLHAMSM